MMITAIPLESEEDTVVLELLKDVTDSLMFGTFDGNDNHYLHNMVSEFNYKLMRDPLTALYNRRFIDERLPADIANAILTKTPLSVGFIDIDDFKHINDHYGHPTGDVVLKTVSNVIRSIIREKDDWAARYGGDEFLICLRNTSYSEAGNVCARIREEIENHPVEVNDMAIKPNVSIGIQTMRDAKLTAAEMIDLADRKMYEEKKRHKKNV